MTKAQLHALKTCLENAKTANSLITSKQFAEAYNLNLDTQRLLFFVIETERLKGFH